MRSTDRPDSRAAAAGFTLVELMIVIVASSLVIAGAFALHQSFSRQTSRLQKIAEVQQTLRVARGYVEKQLRQAGSGFGTGTFVMPMVVNGACQDRTIGGVEFHNLNNIDPTVVDSGHLSEDDPDPDWMEFAYMDVNANPATLDHWTSTNSVEAVINNAQAIANYQECTSMLSLGLPGGYTCVYGLKKVQGQADHININPNGCHDNPCMNNSTNIPRSADDCLCNAATNPDFANFMATYSTTYTGHQLQRDGCDLWSAGQPINAIGPGLGGLRLVPANALTAWPPSGAAASAFGFPILARAKLESQAYTWYQLSEQIEDMQFEIFLNDGTVVGTQGNRRDVVRPDGVPTYGPVNEWPKMRAVRYTLIARSRTQVELGSAFSQTIPRYADRPGGTYTDGYLRRMVQGVVQLRNYGL